MNNKFYYLHLKINIIYIVIILTSMVLYIHSLSCQFVLDDSLAIVNNHDLRPNTTVFDLFKNDFYGTGMDKEASQKSYRPLTVLTYRFNYAFGELNPWGYHFVNIILHAIVSCLFFKLCILFLNIYGATAASFLFCMHPIHVEAVTSVVGRAEMLSAVFFLFALISYSNILSVNGCSNWIIFSKLVLINIFFILGTLCKEQCITVIGVCLAFDFVDQFIKKFYLSQVNIQHEVAKSRKCQKKEKQLVEPSFSGFLYRGCILSVGTFILLAIRVKIMGAELPHCTVCDNPAADADPFSRRLTHLHLVFVNTLLLFYPANLCADWSMGSIPLITKWNDPRNLLTLAAIAGYLIAAARCAYPRTHPKQALALTMGLALMGFPFLPASNLFFNVGFVVAERVLYIPSFGFCLILGLGFQILVRKVSLTTNTSKRLWYKFGCYGSLILVCFAFSIKTVSRNYDWTDEYTLYTSALKVNQKNVKLWNNVGLALEGKHEFSEALHFFKKAVEVQPNDMGARIHVGRTYVNMGLEKKAEEAYHEGVEYFSDPQKIITYNIRALKIFIYFANLLAKDPKRFEEADALLKRAISLREDYVEAYQNRGSLFAKQRRFSEAEEVYMAGLKHHPTNTELHYNMGVLYLATNRTNEALASFERVLTFEPRHDPSSFILAKIYADSSNPELKEKARIMFEELSLRNFDPVRVHFFLASIYSEFSNFTQAVRNYLAVLEHDPLYENAQFNLALVYHYDLNQSYLAIPLLLKLIEVHPSHAKSYLLLGDIQLSTKTNIMEASDLFSKAAELAPDDFQARHNLCMAILKTEDLLEAERCLVEAAKLASPEDSYVFEQLDMIRSSLQQNQNQVPST